MHFQKILFITLSFIAGLLSHLSLALAVDLNTSSCIVSNSSDRDIPGSLRYKIKNYNLPEFRFCTDLIEFKNDKKFNIKLSNKIKIDNRRDRDCTSEDLRGCNDGRALLIDGERNNQTMVTIDTTAMSNDRCAIEINSNGVTLKGLKIIGKQDRGLTRDKANVRAVICDNGQNNHFSEIEYDRRTPAVPEACGNNKKEGNEECDDGNIANSDGCSSACTQEKDTDQDGIIDDLDNCDEIANAGQEDCDSDGMGDACDNDWDNDEIADAQDNCAPKHDTCQDQAILINLANTNQADKDEDGFGDQCDPDLDGDHIITSEDNCPLDYNPDQKDEDQDGRGAACDDTDLVPVVDTDGDGTIDPEDNCPSESNADQKNTDSDDHGDMCDIDDDQDGISDIDEVTRGTDPLVDDSDGDGMKDGIDLCPKNADTDCTDPNITPGSDADSDGKMNSEDNCPTNANPDQEDADSDQIGDACDLDNPEADSDNDGKKNSEDNCPSVSNSDQEDDDTDNIGNACDPAPQEPAARTPVANNGGCDLSLTGMPASSSSGISYLILSILSMWSVRRRKQNKE